MEMRRQLIARRPDLIGMRRRQDRRRDRIGALVLEPVEPDVGTGIVGAPECGDVMKLQLKISDDGVVQDARFKTFGCGSAIASSSYVTELVKGKTIDEVMEIKNTHIVQELSLPPVKIHCSVLAEDGIKAAISDWKKKREGGQPKPEAKAG